MIKQQKENIEINFETHTNPELNFQISSLFVSMHNTLYNMNQDNINTCEEYHQWTWTYHVETYETTVFKQIYIPTQQQRRQANSIS